jgi:catechol 2,3-dioxygenase
MTYRTHPETHVGHIHLKVSDLDRSVAFYRDVMGFDLVQLYGPSAAFLSAGGYHHHIGLNTWESAGASPGPRRAPGLYHVAFLYPDRTALAQALANVVAAGVEIEGASDHGVSEAIYFSDPDGNGIEIYTDRDPAEWPRRENGELAMGNAPLDIPALLALA